MTARHSTCSLSEQGNRDSAFTPCKGTRPKLARVDPCAISVPPFCLDVGDFGLLLPRADLDPQQHKDAGLTLQVLGLNQPNCTVRRRVWADDFMANAHHYGDPLMQRWHP